MKLRRVLGFIADKLISDGARMVVLSGPAMGMRWIKGAGNNGCWLGTYEREKARLFAKSINKGDIVFDIGAHAGYYTLIASRMVGGKGKVYVFEPAERNAVYLRKHVEINNCKNIEIIQAAVTNYSGDALFDTRGGSYEGKINASGGEVTVRAIKLDDFVKNDRLPSCIKIDVEGEELNVLKGAANTLNQYCPTVFLATHGEGIHVKCVEVLSSLGYKIESINSGELVAF